MTSELVREDYGAGVDFFNLCAIVLLERLGDLAPSQGRIDTVEATLKIFYQMQVSGGVQ